MSLQPLLIEVTVEKHGHAEGSEAHSIFRQLLRLEESERFPYEFDGLRDGIAYELDWGSGGGEIYKDFFKVLYYKIVVGGEVKKLAYYVRDKYPDEVFNGFAYAKREADRMSPILSLHGVDIEVLPVKRLTKKD